MARRNPSLSGVIPNDPMELVESSLGLIGTAAVHNAVAKPLASRVSTPDSWLGKGADVLSAFVSSFVVGEVVGVLSGGAGRRAHFGGNLYATGVAASKVVPGIGISASYPSKLGPLSLPGGGGQLALPAGAAAKPTPALAPYAQPDYPHPAANDRNVGL